MLDIKFLRANPEIVKENIRKKYQEHKLPLVDEILLLDEQQRTAQTRCEYLRSERNSRSKSIGALLGKGEKEAAEAAKAQVGELAEELAALEKTSEQIGRAHV